MEAADDICYRIVDIEDALELKLCQLNDVRESFFMLGGKKASEEMTTKRKEIISLRTIAINNLIDKCVQIFKENYSEIMAGNFEDDLISKLDGIEKEGLKTIKEITTNKIFSDRRKIELEIGSYSTFDIIMVSFIDAVNQFKNDPENVPFKSEKLLQLLDEKLEIDESYYQNYMKINDHVSGMTDNYATFIAGQINGHAK